MGNFMIPVCCICGKASPTWHNEEWENSGGLQDFCPHHATIIQNVYGLLVEYPTWDGGKNKRVREIKMIEEEIVKLLDNNCPCDPKYLADQILSLPVEGCGEVKEKCPNPECVNGLVPARPNHLGIKHHGTKQACDVCNSYGFISRPLTLGELPERARKMREALEYYESKESILGSRAAKALYGD